MAADELLREAVELEGGDARADLAREQLEGATDEQTGLTHEEELLVGAALLLPDQTPPDDDPEPPVVADYPVPPLDLAVPPTPKRRRRAVTAARGDDREAETVTAGAKEGDR